MNGIMKMAFDLLPAKKMLGYLYQIGVITHLFTFYFLRHLRPASNSFRDNAWHAKTTQVWGVTEKNIYLTRWAPSSYKWCYNPYIWPY